MNPAEIAKAYDQITDRWNSDRFCMQNGIEAHNRAIQFTKNKGMALDVGCGCTGRFIDLLTENGFHPEGLDISPKMIELAKERHPKVGFHMVDICKWSPACTYDFISAWDSIWHIPLAEQKPVIRKLIGALAPNGVLIFSFGGTHEPGSHNNNIMGPEVHYSTLGTHGFLSLALEENCICKHLEYDQFPELHCYMILQKAGNPSS